MKEGCLLCWGELWALALQVGVGDEVVGSCLPEDPLSADSKGSLLVQCLLKQSWW